MKASDKKPFAIDLPREGGFKALFCPVSLISGLVKLGGTPKTTISPRSHKCQFRLNERTLMTEFRVRTNTFARMAKRVWNHEPSTGLMLKECIVPLVWGIELAARYPEFYANYPTIRDGLYNLMICYSYDGDVTRAIAAVLDCMPRTLDNSDNASLD